MAVKQPKKQEAAVLALPDTDEAADALLREYGEKFNELAIMQAQFDTALAAIKVGHQQNAAPLQARLVDLFAMLQAYGDLHRARLTEGETKTVKLPAGEVGWRKSPPSVKLRTKKKLDDAIAEIRELRLPRFLRRVWEINKQAILADPETAAKLKTLRIAPGEEEFFVAPFGAKLAEPKQ